MSLDAITIRLAHGFRELASTQEEKRMRKLLSNAVPICIIVCVALAALSLLEVLAYPNIPTITESIFNVVICYDLARMCYNIKQITDDAKQHIKLHIKGPEAMAEHIVSYTVLARFFSSAIADVLSDSRRL